MFQITQTSNAKLINAMPIANEHVAHVNECPLNLHHHSAQLSGIRKVRIATSDYTDGVSVDPRIS